MRESEATSPWSNVYGLARTLIALSTMATLALNDASVLWIPAAGFSEAPICGGSQLVPSLFCFAPDSLHLVKWAAVVALAIVASGWRPRFTGALHWWVTHSFVSSALLADGGDQLASTLTLLLIPLTLTDRRRWHWDAAPPGPTTQPGCMLAGLGWSTLWVLRLLVAMVFLDAAMSKWIATGAIAFEGVFLGGLFVRNAMLRRLLLVAGFIFYFGTAVERGLPSFAIIMFAALILLLRREDEAFSLRTRRLFTLARRAFTPKHRGRPAAGVHPAS